MPGSSSSSSRGFGTSLKQEHTPLLPLSSQQQQQPPPPTMPTYLFSPHPPVSCTGAGKTLVAAEVIRRKLPALKAATKAVLFMAPTNPLVAQVCAVTHVVEHGGQQCVPTRWFQ